jgi:hypothetical protein
MTFYKEFENQNFAIFEEVVNDFGRSDDNIVKKHVFYKRHMCFHA